FPGEPGSIEIEKRAIALGQMQLVIARHVSSARGWIASVAVRMKCRESPDNCRCASSTYAVGVMGWDRWHGAVWRRSRATPGAAAVRRVVVKTKEKPRPEGSGRGAGRAAQSPLRREGRDQMRLKVSPSSSSKRLA